MLPLEKSEVLRYLGYKRKQELTPEVSKQVDELMIEVQVESNAHYRYQIFDIDVDTDENEVRVLGTDLILPGKNITNHLKRAKKVALLVSTLGIDIERVIRKYEMTDMTKAFILDSACVEYIEKVCDLAEVDIDDAVGDGWTLNRRFSPGYGDLPLAVQPDFLRVMDAGRTLGINLTDTMLMVPRKSVTAIIGLFDDPSIARPRRKVPDDLPIELVHTSNFRVGE
jgi:hypothetical protein